MIKQISIILLVLLTGFFVGCSDDELRDSPDGQPERGIVVKLTTGELETKTHLYSQASWHHVRKVYAILYYCGDMTVENINPDSCTVVTSQLLMKNGNPWNPSTDESYGQGVEQTETFELILPEDQIAMVPGKYLILCVGLDDVSADTYALNYESETIKPTFTETGKTLSDAYAIFNKTAETTPIPYEKDPVSNETDKKQDKDLIAYGQPDIAHSELFSGWQAFDFMPDDLNVVEVELHRRVAGVLCYLSDVPYKLNVGDKPYRVTRVCLNLFEPQNAQISLMRDVTYNGQLSETDFGKKVEGKEVSQILCEFDLMGFTQQPVNGEATGDLLYQIPTLHLEGRKQLENTILMGAYLLPIQNKGTEATMTVTLWGYEYDDSSSDHIAEGKGPENVEPTLIKSFPAIYEGKELDPKIYSFHPNMIYHIGHKLENDNTEGDYPESLAGTKVVVQAEPWQEIDIPVEFPSIPIIPLISLLNTEGHKYKTESVDEVDSYYIFNCIGTLTDYLEISSSILYEKWKLTAVVPGGSGEPWIQFWDESTSAYVKELYGSGGKYIHIRMNDYASVQDWENNQKTRSILLKLEALDENGNIVNDAYSTLKVEQYNALIVKMEDDEDGYRGFSHFDFGTKRNPITGEEDPTTARSTGWGYWSSYPLATNHENGKYNYTFLLEYWPGSFKESAVQICGLGAYGSELDLEKEEEPVWYLAAREELLLFMRSYGHDTEAHIKADSWYWTSNQAGWGVGRAVACRWQLPDDAESDSRDKENSYYLRQTCHAQ